MELARRLVFGESISDVTEMLKADADCPVALLVILDALREAGYNDLAEHIDLISKGEHLTFATINLEFQDKLYESYSDFIIPETLRVHDGSVQFSVRKDLVPNFDPSRSAAKPDRFIVSFSLTQRHEAIRTGIDKLFVLRIIGYNIKWNTSEVYGNYSNLEDMLVDLDPRIHDLAGVCYCWIIGCQLAMQQKRNVGFDKDLHQRDRIVGLRLLAKIELYLEWAHYGQALRAVEQLPGSDELARAATRALDQQLRHLEQYGNALRNHDDRDIEADIAMVNRMREHVNA